jgi:cytochrome c oxidase assembly factor CtaG
MTALLALLLLIGAGSPASAHESQTGAEGWPAALAIAIAATLILSAWIGRRARLGTGEAAAVFAGLALLAAAVVGPLPSLENRSLAAHMVSHELLLVGAAPLLAGARAWRRTVPALPLALRRSLAALLRRARTPLAVLPRPLPATLLSAAVLWAWHLPGPFEAALRSPALHALQHASFFGTALLFWAAMLAPAHWRRDGAAMLYLFVTALQTGALGALMTFSPRSWYALEGTPPLGLSPIEDQQLAGLIMWIPGGLVYAAAALLMFARVLSRPGAALPVQRSGA